MPKLPECNSCLLYSHNPHLVCAVHPAGPEGDTCLDYRLDPNAEVEELWEPEGASYYAGELILHKPRLTREQQWWLIDNHPMFTGRCPLCGHQFDLNNPPAVHWDCPNQNCGWIDDAIH